MAERDRGGAAVLAGGRSTRMGRDKATLTLDGDTILERTSRLLQSLADPVIIVGSRSEGISHANIQSISDRYPRAGPVAGIVTALHSLGQGAHLVVACDLPFLQADLLRALQDFASEDFDALVPFVGDRPEPLCAVYNYSALEPLEEFLREGGRAAHLALERIRTRRIDEPTLRRYDPDLVSFINLNTPDDVRRWIGPTSQ